jgi:hypothetical protein
MACAFQPFYQQLPRLIRFLGSGIGDYNYSAFDYLRRQVLVIFVSHILLLHGVILRHYSRKEIDVQSKF